ncbi:hypothetical protein QQP08_019624 [Theobroma cacao]|nr:hypothetical protein QQP08_019624 [Theobroma cacao]
MDTDLEKLQNFPLLKFTRNSSISPDPEIEDEPRYTSLKDVILSSSPPPCRLINQEGNEFDYSKIIIRNRLVKSAASAYLQSAAILANRNENCLLNLWGKLKNNVASSFSCWNVYFRDPFEACFGAIYQFLACTLGGAWGRIFGYQETLLNER